MKTSAVKVRCDSQPGFAEKKSMVVSSRMPGDCSLSDVRLCSFSKYVDNIMRRSGSLLMFSNVNCHIITFVESISASLNCPFRLFLYRWLVEMIANMEMTMSTPMTTNKTRRARVGVKSECDFLDFCIMGECYSIIITKLISKICRKYDCSECSS